MQIALVHMRHAPIGGTELVLDRLAATLAQRGHAVTIVCRTHGAESRPDVRFEVLASASVGSAWRMWAFAKDVERHVQRASYDLVLALGKTWTHDVIRSSGGSHATYVEQMRRAGGLGWRGRPLLGGLKDRMAVAIERRAYARGAYRRVIANSRMVRDDLGRRYGVAADEVDVVYNGVDLARFHPRHRASAAEVRRELGLAAGDFVFLFLGTGFARKGLERTLRAFAQVAAVRRDCALVVAGRDSSQASYERLAAELGIAARVHFLGERRDPEAWLAASEVHVLPTWYDSFAFTVLEALASGTPVITTDGAGAAELIEPGVHGERLASACSPDELAAAMFAWADRDRVRAAAPAVRERAEQFGFDAAMAQLAGVLERAALSKAPMEALGRGQ